MKKTFLALAILSASASASMAFLGDVFDAIGDLFSSEDKAKIELFDHIESTIFTQHPKYFMYFETDFENTGKPYLWISHDKNDLGSGSFFNIYKKVDEHYELLADYAVFTPELLAFYGKDYSNNRPRIITYSKISGQEGNLVVYKIDENDKIFSMVYKKIEPMGEDSELFEKLFPENNSFIKKVPADDMVKFLDSRGIKSPKRDNIEFLAFDLGGKTGTVLLTTDPSKKVGASGWSAFNLQRKDTLLNDIGLGFIGVDLSLDNLIPFEVRNPGWKRLQVFPQGRKIIFFKNFSFIREIDKRKFLITLNRDGDSDISISFYQLSFNRVCAFDISDIKVRESSEGGSLDAENDGYKFLKALDFDFDKDSKYFNYKQYPAKDVVYNGNEINIPKDFDVDSNIYDIKSVTLPEENKYTIEFRKKWSEIRQQARAAMPNDGKKSRQKSPANLEKTHATNSPKTSASNAK